MKTFWDWFWLIVFLYFIFKAFAKIDSSLNLLNDLSDDINDIKRKLGVSVENRTIKQQDEASRKYFEEEVSRGRTLQDFRNSLGFWEFRRWKWLIKSCLKGYPRKTKCPKCQKIDNENSDGDCVDCEIKVVPLKESNKDKKTFFFKS